MIQIKTASFVSGFLLFCLVFAADFSFAKNPPEFKSGKVIIAGHVELSKNSSKVISLAYSQLSGNPTRLSLILDSTGRFQFEFDILHAHDIAVRYEKGEAQLYVQPLDSLYIQLNSADFQQSKYAQYLITGTNPETSRNILSYHYYNKLESFKPSPANKSTEEYLLDLKKRIFTEDSVLSLFNKNYNPNTEFRTWAKKDITYRNANYLANFEYYHSVHGTKFTGVLYDTTLFPVNDTDAVISSWYQYHLWQYTMAKYIQGDSAIQNLFKEHKSGDAFNAGLQKILAGEKPGTGRDIMCYQILYTLSEKENNRFQRLMKNVGQYVSNKELASLLQEKVRQGEDQAKYQVSFFKTDSKEEKEMIGDLMENLITKHRGKIIYIDIWATWCGPCRSEVPFAIDLHDYYKAKPIVFVNLCLLSDRETWKKAIEKQKIAGENYYFDKDQSELLKSKLKLSGFPTYMIIDKNGQIVDKQAPRPSSGSTIKTYLTRLME